MTTFVKNPIKTLSLIHLVMVAGPLLVGTILYLNTNIKMDGSIGDDIFVYVFPLMALVGIFSGKYIYNILLNNLKKNDDLQQKLVGYQTASFVKWGLLEGPALLNIMWFSTNGNLLFLTVGGTLLVFLFAQRPTKSKIENELELKGEHKRAFDRLD